MNSIHSFSQLTTLHLGGNFIDLIDLEDVAVVSDFQRSGEDFFLIGAGSNLVVTDDALDCCVMRLAANLQSLSVANDDHDDAYLTVGAGCLLDDVIAWAVDCGLGGLELLSGIPGTVGGGVVQNVGAYGIEISQLLHSALIYDRVTHQSCWYLPAALGFSYRNSLLKFTQRYIVVQVNLYVTRDNLSAQLSYPELLTLAGVTAGTRLPTADVRQLVCHVRKNKGMVLIPGDYDTWSVGSFFTNPILDQQQLSQLKNRILGSDVVFAQMPMYPQADGMTKLSAAWLIEHSGFYKGYPGPQSDVRISTKHTLVLTNRGTGTTRDLLSLAREIQVGVNSIFGVWLTPEPIFLGCTLGGDERG